MLPLFTIDCTFRYDIIRKIAEGGMGVVYEANQHGTRDFIKKVAIKIIKQHYANQPEFIENFIGEAKLVADLIHTNIVQTYHLGESNGIYFIAMEMIHGPNLEQIINKLVRSGQKMPIELAVFITSRVARGLAYAHLKKGKDGQPLGIVHRDVSPKNILIGFEGDVKLSDFGIAKAKGFLPENEGEVAVGKADYMSPEQANFQITDKRSDIFSAGIVLAHLLLGYNPFHAPSPSESLERIRNMPIPNFQELDHRIDQKLNQILQRMLARNPNDRYPNASELLYELEFYIYHAGYGPTNETMAKYMRDIFQVDSWEELLNKNTQQFSDSINSTLI